MGARAKSELRQLTVLAGELSKQAAAAKATAEAAIKEAPAPSARGFRAGGGGGGGGGVLHGSGVGGAILGLVGPDAKSRRRSLCL